MSRRVAALWRGAKSLPKGRSPSESESEQGAGQAGGLLATSTAHAAPSTQRAAASSGGVDQATPKFQLHAAHRVQLRVCWGADACAGRQQAVGLAPSQAADPKPGELPMARVKAL